MEPLRKYEGDVWDRRQESRLSIGEPLQLKRLENGWCYVISDSTEGYAKTEGIFVCSRRHYEKYRELVAREYQVVLKSGRYRDGQYFRVGTVLPVFEKEENEGDVFGTEGEVQKLFFARNRTSEVRGDGPVMVRSFLPFTHRQMRLQMERMLEIPYSWGDERVDGLDCSSTVRAFYACFGLFLPRNTGELQSYGEMLSAMQQAMYADLTGVSVDKKKEKIAAMGIGAVLHVPGHVLIYAGEKDGEMQVFHNCDTYPENGEEKIVRRCIISGFLPRGDGNTLDYLTAVWKPCLES